MSEPLRLSDCQALEGAPDQRWSATLEVPGERQPRHVIVLKSGQDLVAIPRYCRHEGKDFAHCPVGSDGRIVCPEHGEAVDTRCEAHESLPVTVDQGEFLVSLPAAKTSSIATLEAEELRQELEALRQANTALESELLASTTTLDSLIDTLHSQQEQLKRRTREIETLNAFMERAVDTMGELFFLLHANGQVRQANALAQRALGIGADRGQLEDYLATADREHLAATLSAVPGESLVMAAIRAAAGHYETELNFRMVGGLTQPHLVRGSLLYGTSGKLEGAVVIASNIAYLKEREETARDAEAMFRLTAGAAHDAIVLISSNDRILFWNRAAERLFGYASEEVLGQPMHDLLLTSGGRPPQIATGLERFRSPGQGAVVGRTQEVTAHTRDGRLLTVELAVLAVEIKGVWHAIGLMRDITQRKLAEAELRMHRDHLADLVTQQTGDLMRAKEAAEAANQAKSEFIANMSHELRTPMHAILSFSRLGLDRADSASPQKIVNYFDRIHSSGERLTVLINDLLDISKLESGRMEINPAVTDLITLMDKACTELKPLFTARNIRLRLHTDGSTEAWADPVRMHQVITNLLSNALRFSPEGGEIAFEFLPDFLPGREVGTVVPALLMQITDQGPGVPDSELENIFDKFVQSSRTKTGAGGTGLGLYICREYLKLHGGSIHARNVPGAGACFEVRLPRQKP